MCISNKLSRNIHAAVNSKSDYQMNKTQEFLKSRVDRGWYRGLVFFIMRLFGALSLFSGIHT